MEKAIEIKRRAQRCILNGDLDGALIAYEKLVASGESDPYHSVLLADLLYKKGDQDGAGRRYLEAVDGYEKVSLFKNAIAVCKKMSRLSLSSTLVLERLARLHALDGLATESSLYYMQHAELLARKDDHRAAAKSYGLAFEVCPDNVQSLERLAETYEAMQDIDAATRTLTEAASNYERLGQVPEAARCRRRAETLQPGSGSSRVSTREAVRTNSPMAAGEAAPNDAAPVYEIDATPDAAPVFEIDASPDAAPVYEIDASPDEAPVYEIDASPDEAPVYDIDASLDAAPEPSGVSTPTYEVGPWTSATPPGLEASPDPVRNGADLQQSTPSKPALESEARGGPLDSLRLDESLEGPEGLPEVSVFLKEAQTHFQNGNRDAASTALVRAAQTYDRTGKLDSAASIYRSLSQVIEAPLQVMLLWLKNCQRRDDRAEAARVACELGNRALVDGDSAGAREWFERARAFDERNEMAARRLEHLRASAGEGSVATATVAEWITPPAEAEPVAEPPLSSATPREITMDEQALPKVASGLIEVALDPEGPLDLGSMIAEFQRGLEEQLAGDSQAHYDLAMSYREMGLYEQAIVSFRLAAHAPEFHVRSAEMIGRCLLDLGNFDEAARELEDSIARPGVDPGTTVDLRYQLGLALEAGGATAHALQEFERVYAAEPNYPDVAFKIRTLRKSLEKT